MQTQVEVERNDLWTSSATNQLPPPHPNCYCFALPEARSWNEHRRHSSNESCWTRAIAVNVRVGKIYEGSDHQEPFVHSFIHLSIHPFIHSAIQLFSHLSIWLDGNCLQLPPKDSSSGEELKNPSNSFQATTNCNWKSKEDLYLQINFRFTEFQTLFSKIIMGRNHQ